MLRKNRIIWPSFFGLLILLCCGFVLTDAHAQLHSCEQGGKKVFQDKPCENKAENQTAAGNSPAGIDRIHSSWFAKPEYYPGGLTCAKSGCLCGRSEENRIVYYHRKKNEKFLHPLRTLISSWKNLNSRLKYLGRKSSMREGDLAKLQSVACDIMIKQEIVKSLYSEYSNRIRQDIVTAEQKLERSNNKCVRPVADQNVTDAAAVAWLECSSTQHTHQRKAEANLDRAKNNLAEMKRLLNELQKPLG